MQSVFLVLYIYQRIILKKERLNTMHLNNSIKKCIFCLAVLVSMLGLQTDIEAKNGEAYKSTQATFYAQRYGLDSKLFIIGHKNPDSDTVFSAYAYAELKNKLGIPAEAVVFGLLNDETQYAIDYFGIKAPESVTTVEGKRLVLVDHATYKQAAEGIHNAEVVEIVDHHQFGDIVPKKVIAIRCMPWGSTNTIIYQMYLENNIKPSRRSAGAMLTGILSDTRNLRNNASVYDIKAVEELQKLAKLKDKDAFYKEMVKAAASYKGKSDKEILNLDSKEFVFNGYKVFITCVKAKTAADLEAVALRMHNVMPEAFKEKDVDMMFACVTCDGVAKSAIAYYGANSKEVAEKAYGTAKDDVISVEKELLRKVNLVPDLSSEIDKLTTKN